MKTSGSSKLPRVFIDARMVGPVPHGIAKYVTGLALGLSKLKESTRLPYDPVFFVGKDFPTFESGSVLSKIWTSFEKIVVDARFLHPKEWIEIPIALKRNRADLYHSTSFSSLLVSPVPTVVTLHDLNHLQFGHFFQKQYYLRVVKAFAHRSRFITTVSEFSKREIQDWLGGAPEVIVVPNAVDLEKLLVQSVGAGALSRWNLTPRKYFLSLSNRKPHKNLETLFQAYGKYQEEMKGQGWPWLVSVKEAPALPGLIPIAGVSSECASELNANAGAVLFPSLYEGFGLPPVEALVAGTPSVLSDIAPHRESLGFALPHEVTWVKPMDVEGWTRALKARTDAPFVPPSKESRENVLSRYNSQMLGNGMDLIYRRILGLSL